MASKDGSPRRGEERRSLGGEHLTFRLGSETYGVEILKVHEIVGIMKITPVPQTPDFIRGVVNLRGRVIPVVDLRLKFGMPLRDYNNRTCIIVVQVERGSGTMTMGLIVDEVSEVIMIDPANVDPPPQFGAGVDVQFILGMGKVDASVVILLDVDRVLTGGDLEALQDLPTEQAPSE